MPAPLSAGNTLIADILVQAEAYLSRGFTEEQALNFLAAQFPGQPRTALIGDIASARQALDAGAALTSELAGGPGGLFDPPAVRQRGCSGQYLVDVELVAHQGAPFPGGNQWFDRVVISDPQGSNMLEAGLQPLLDQLAGRYQTSADIADYSYRVTAVYRCV